MVDRAALTEGWVWHPRDLLGVPTQDHLSRPLPGLERTPGLPGHSGGTLRTLRGATTPRPTRSVHRRHLQRCKKGGADVGPTKKGKGTKIMIMVDASGVPLAVHTCSASPAEVTLVQDTLDASFGMDFPNRLIGDKAYDSDGLDAELAGLGIEMIAPNRRNRRKTQDGRPLRRYRRRWKVERTIAWLQSFRRVRTRDEVKAQNFLGMVQLACIVILLRLIS